MPYICTYCTYIFKQYRYRDIVSWWG